MEGGIIEEYWKLKPLRFSPAIRFKPIKIISLVKPIRTKVKRFNRDTDFDGTPDNIDCQPRNPMAQHDWGLNISNVPIEDLEPDIPVYMYAFDSTINEWVYLGGRSKIQAASI